MFKFPSQDSIASSSTGSKYKQGNSITSSILSSSSSSSSSSLFSLGSPSSNSSFFKKISLLPFLFGDNRSSELCSTNDWQELFDEIKQIDKFGCNIPSNNNQFSNMNHSLYACQRGSSSGCLHHNSTSNVIDNSNLTHSPELNSHNHCDTNQFLNTTTRRKLTPTSINSSLSSNNVADECFDEFLFEKKCNVIRKHFEKFVSSQLDGFELCKLLNIYSSILFQTPLSIVLLYDEEAEELIGSFPSKGTWNSFIPKTITNRWVDYKSTCMHNNHKCNHCKYINSPNEQHFDESVINSNFTNSSFTNIIYRKDSLEKKKNELKISLLKNNTFQINKYGRKTNYNEKMVNRRATFPPISMKHIKSGYISRNNIALTQDTNKAGQHNSDSSSIKCQKEEIEYDILRFSLLNKSFLKQILSQGQKQNFFYFNYSPQICDYIIKSSYVDEINEAEKNNPNNFLNSNSDNIFGLYFFNKLKDLEQLPCDIAIATQCPICTQKNDVVHNIENDNNDCSNSEKASDDFLIRNTESIKIDSNNITQNFSLNPDSQISSIELMNDNNNINLQNSYLNIGEKKNFIINEENTEINEYPVILVSPPSINGKSISKCCICEKNKSNINSNEIISEFSDTDIGITNFYQRYSNFKVPVISCPIVDTRINLKKNETNQNQIVGLIICLQPQNPNILLLRNLVLELQSLICLFLDYKRLLFNMIQFNLYYELHRWAFKPLLNQKRLSLNENGDWSISVEVISRICKLINKFTPVQHTLVYVLESSNEFICIFGPKQFIGYRISSDNSLISNLLKNKTISIKNDLNNKLFSSYDKSINIKVINSAFIPIFNKNDNINIIIQLINRLNIQCMSLGTRIASNNIDSESVNNGINTNEKKNSEIDRERDRFHLSNSNSNSKLANISSNNIYIQENESIILRQSNSIQSISSSEISKLSYSSVNSFLQIPLTFNLNSSKKYKNETANCNFYDYNILNIDKSNTIEYLPINNIPNSELNKPNKLLKIIDFSQMDLFLYKSLVNHMLQEFQQQISSLNIHLYYKSIRNPNFHNSYTSNQKILTSLKNNFGLYSKVHSPNRYSLSSNNSQTPLTNQSINFNHSNYQNQVDQTLVVNFSNEEDNPDDIQFSNISKLKSNLFEDSQDFEHTHEQHCFENGSINTNNSNNINMINNNTITDNESNFQNNHQKSQNINDNLNLNNTTVNGNSSVNANHSYFKNNSIDIYKREVNIYNTKIKKKIDSYLSLYREWGFPIWVHSWLTHREFLLNLYRYFGFDERWNWKHSDLVLLFDRIHDSYNNEIPYHNILHGLQVVQACYIVLRKFGVMLVLNDIQKFTLLFAALCHDIDHPGVNNSFLITVNSKLARKYNDSSVLENHHCNFTFTMLENNDFDLRKSFNDEEKKVFRKLFIRSVLSTDMNYHNNLLNILEDFISNNDASNYNPEIENEDEEIDMKIFGGEIHENSLLTKIDKELLIESLLHAADISNPLTPFPICSKWASLIQEEFSIQVKLEQRFDLPITPFMDLKEELPKIEAQLGFLEYAVIPQWKILSRIIPKSIVLLKHAELNREIWIEKSRSLVSRLNNEDQESRTKENLDDSLFDFTLDYLKNETIGGKYVLNKVGESDEIMSRFRCDKFSISSNIENSKEELLIEMNNKYVDDYYNLLNC